MLHVKFDNNWCNGFREKNCLKVLSMPMGVDYVVIGFDMEVLTYGVRAIRIDVVSSH